MINLTEAAVEEIRTFAAIELEEKLEPIKYNCGAGHPPDILTMLSPHLALKWSLLATYAALNVVAIKRPELRMERLDELLWESNFVSSAVGTCVARDNSTVAAQWVRLAYHDMSTHNVDDGSGGLDASIVFELDRPQNVGKGMTDSINDFRSSTEPTVTLSDLIAMGAIMGTVSCGGPMIPFRGGRVDATSAGPATVPEPQQDLASHTESFRQQGFTQSEMISLVACGHSLGGVRREDFPDIVQTPVDGNVALFDGTKLFDNAVVTGYLQGTTPNPLAVGPNATTNSDLRIFSSDGNATMQSIASPDTFNKVCADLFERMINTVPKGVQLTEVVEPIEYKVGQAWLFPGDEGAFRFVTSLRMLHKNPLRTVKLFWSDRQGSACPSPGCSASPSDTFGDSGTPMTNKAGLSLSFYEFDTKINMTSSISKFWFEVDEGDGSAVARVDDDGAGFPIVQDAVLLDRGRISTESDKSGTFLIIVIAARNADASSRITITTYQPGVSVSKPIPTRQTLNLSVDPRFPPMAGYTFFSAKVPFRQEWFDLKAEIGGEVFEQQNILASRKI
ncbi:hypothetical protein V5O48_006210 [Marasmius crinis-equi]|uniref:Peroxidase n=1 Tax=Marasmius crinis-equi TaxID=585013 RepID=A0ABR3FKC4_9AGAR